jgi:hypothetical protein
VSAGPAPFVLGGAARCAFAGVLASAASLAVAAETASFALDTLASCFAEGVCVFARRTLFERVEAVQPLRALRDGAAMRNLLYRCLHTNCSACGREHTPHHNNAGGTKRPVVGQDDLSL